MVVLEDSVSKSQYLRSMQSRMNLSKRAWATVRKTCKQCLPLCSELFSLSLGDGFRNRVFNNKGKSGLETFCAGMVWTLYFYFVFSSFLANKRLLNLKCKPCSVVGQCYCSLHLQLLPKITFLAVAELTPSSYLLASLPKPKFQACFTEILGQSDVTIVNS